MDTSVVLIVAIFALPLAFGLGLKVEMHLVPD